MSQRFHVCKVTMMVTTITWKTPGGLSEQVCGVLAINVALDQKYKEPEDINE